MSEDPRFETIREAREKALNALNAGIPGSLDAFLHWENVADAALDSLAADLEAARETLLVISGWDASAAKRHAAMGMREYASATLARLSAGKETGDE